MREPAAEKPSARAAARGLAGRRGAWLAVTLGAACFLNTLPHDFTYDDRVIIGQNPRIHSLANLREIWLTDWWHERETSESVADPHRDRLYRPLTMFTFALNYAVGRLDPVGYHALNIALHAITCGLVWLLARRLIADEAIATIAAAVFAVHPIHCEAVAGIVGRAEILAALGLCGGLVVLLARETWPSPARCLAAAVCFLGALLAKETAICYIPVALLALWWVYPAAVRSNKGWLAAASLLAAPLLVYFPLRLVALEQHLIRAHELSPIFNPLFASDFAGRLVNPLHILGHYTRLMIAPAALSSDYGLAVVRPAPMLDVMTALGAVAAVALAFALAGLRSRSANGRLVGLLTALVLASYALISNTVLLIGVSLAERLLYWPSVPIILLLTTLVVIGWRRWSAPGGPLHARARLLRTVGILLLAALALRSVTRNMDWADDLTLFSTDVANWPESVQLNYAVATQLIYAGYLEVNPERRIALLHAARSHLERALAIRPQLTTALRAMGEVHALLGERDKAAVYLESARQLDPRDLRTQQQLSRLRAEQSGGPQRIAELEQQISRQPDDLDARTELGRLLLAAGRHHAARAHLEYALERRPDDVELMRLTAQALMLDHEDEPAIELFRRVLVHEPDDWLTHANLVNLLAPTDPEGTLHHAQRAFELNPDDLRTQINLAEAYATAGQPDQAARRLREIVRRIPREHPMHSVLEQRIGELERRRR